MIVTIGCPHPEATLHLLARALARASTPPPAAAVSLWPTHGRNSTLVVSTAHSDLVLTQPTTAVSPANVRIRCVPSPFSRILAIQQQQTSNSEQSKEESFQLANRQSSGLRESVQAWTTYIRHQGRIPLKYCYPSIPVLMDVRGDITTSESSSSANDFHYVDGQLKEIAIPDPGGVLLDNLAQHAAIQRVVTGVYGIPTQTHGCRCYIRPLPIAVQDHRIPIPTLVFHSTETRNSKPPEDDDEADGDRSSWARIGDRGGSSTSGQWMHTILQERNMLDVRLCSSLGSPKSMFTEAQTSLLAGSLENLQSNRVLDAKTTSTDAKTNQADCWIEVREQAVQRIRKDTAV